MEFLATREKGRQPKTRAKRHNETVRSWKDEPHGLIGPSIELSPEGGLLRYLPVRHCQEYLSLSLLLPSWMKLGNWIGSVSRTGWSRSWMGKGGY